MNKSFVPNYSKERGDLQMNKYRVGFVVFQTVNAPSIREAERVARTGIVAAQSLWRTEIGEEPCVATKLVEG